ncbi:MAG: hypothetical protein K2Q22_15975 [Cytophagales bacterium]|nr:hypothetical protein [Cytophagales bacterium]
MNRLVLGMILYALVFTANGRPILEIDDIHQINLSSPYLFYRFPASGDTSWKEFKEEFSTIAPLTPFEVKFDFRCGPEESIVFEWPDNKIEDLEAFVLNSKGDTCAKLVYADVKGYSSALYIKNQILILYHPVQGEVYTLQYKLNSHNPPYTVI